MIKKFNIQHSQEPKQVNLTSGAPSSIALNKSLEENTQQPWP